MDDIEAKRVYADRAGATAVLVASELGVTVVHVSGDAVGEFRLARRCVARDVAATDGHAAVATGEDVLVTDGVTVAGTGFGPAAAVGFDGDRLLAADPDGRVAGLDGRGWHEATGSSGDSSADRDGGHEAWQAVGTVESGVRAIDGDLLAAGDGVYLVGDDLRHAGLDDARDVAAGDAPHAATATGLYRLGNGWLDELDGDVRVVAIDDGESGEVRRAHAATADVLYERREGAWTPVTLPVEEPVVGVGYGAATYAVTRSGTFLADAGDGWRSRSLGVPGAAGLAVP